MKMNAGRLSIERLLSRAACVGLVLGAAGAAQARDVYWSVGVQSPGLGAMVSNAPPVMYAPAPVIVVPAPQVVYAPPPVVYAAPPRVVYAPSPVPVYVVPGHPYKYKKHKHHHHHHGEWQSHGWQPHGGHVGHVRHEGRWRH